MDIQQKAVAKKKKTRFFETYIAKVLKQVSETNGITSNAKQQLNSILCIISKIISTSVTNLTEIAKKKTLSEKEVIKIMRSNLKKASFKVWRERVYGRKAKHEKI